MDKKSFKKMQNFRRDRKIWEINKHHIINRCRKDSYNLLSDDDNKVVVNRLEHDMWHELFANQAPHEVFKSLERRLWWVMNAEAKELLSALQSENIYKDKFIKKD